MYAFRDAFQTGDDQVRLNKFLAEAAHIIVRKDDIMCTRCAEIEPVHPGHGTPLPAFVMALAMAVQRHGKCANKRETK